MARTVVRSHDMQPTGVTPGEYEAATVTVDAAGRITAIEATPGGAVLATDLVFNEVPGGDVDGTNTDFTLADAPVEGTVIVHRNGVRQRPGAGNDYTITGGTITFEAGAIPQTGDSVLVDYVKA